MKPLVLGLVLAALSVWRQQPLPGPVEGADVVAILLADRGAIAWRQVARGLQARGYQFVSCDSSTWQLETKSLQTSGQCLTSIEALLVGHAILLSAKT